MSRKLEVTVIGNTRDLDRALGQSEKRVSSFGAKLKGLAKGAGAAAAIGGIALIGKSLWDSVGAAKEAEQAQSRLQSALKSAGVSFAKHGDAIDDAIQKTSKLAAIDDEELSDSFSKLVRTSGSVTKAMDGMSLAADIARARNISLDKATGVVEKAMIGQTRGLKSVGVELEKGMTATQALEKAQKQFAGAAEKHGQTSAAAQQKLGVAFENLQEKVGQKLLPVLAKLANKLVELIDWSEKNWPKFKEAAEPVFDAVMVIINNLVDRMKAIVEGIQGVIKIIKGIRDGEWSTVWAGIKQVVVDGAFGIVKAMLEIPAKIVAALGKKAWSGLSAIGGYISDAIIGGLGAIASGISSAVISAINAAIDLLNRAIGVYNSIPLVPNIGTVNKIGAQAKINTKAPPVAGRAAGGSVSAGTPYIVGEKGRELFVPGQSGTIIPNGGGSTGRGGGGSQRPVVVQLQLDGRTFAELLVDPLRATAQVFAQRNGRTAF